MRPHVEKKPRKVLIVADLEGIIGFNYYAPIETEKKLMNEELQYAIGCILEKEKNCEITVCNIHRDGLLLAEEDIMPARASLLKGVDALVACSWDFDFAIMLGFHGKANSGGIFDHTFRPDFARMWRTENNVDIDTGEVAAFSLWIESKGIPVILVSGEGNFDDEIRNATCRIHKVNRFQSYDEQYCSLDADIAAGLRKEHTLDNADDSAMIFIQVDNLDKVPILESKGFATKDGCIVFDNLECFFRNLYKFAAALSTAYKQVADVNLKFAYSIKELAVEKQDYPELNEIFAKPLELVNEADRNAVKQRLGL